MLKEIWNGKNARRPAVGIDFNWKRLPTVERFKFLWKRQEFETTRKTNVAVHDLLVPSCGIRDMKCGRTFPYISCGKPRPKDAWKIPEKCCWGDQAYWSYMEIQTPIIIPETLQIGCSSFQAVPSSNLCEASHWNHNLVHSSDRGREPLSLRLLPHRLVIFCTSLTLSLYTYCI